MYSPFIYAMIDWLRRCGVEVHNEPPPHPSAAGLYRSETKEIWLHPELSAQEALLTLAHEAGHWIGYLIHERRESGKREQQAYVYGWHVLRWFDAPVTRSEWVAECRAAAARRIGRVQDIPRTH